jgi:gliding motility-associated-like protein
MNQKHVLTKHHIMSFSTNLKSSFLLCFFFIFTSSLSAKHIVGGDMTYRYLSDVNDSTKLFEITLVVYRSCGLDPNGQMGGPFDDPAIFGLFKGNRLSANYLSKKSILITSQADIEPVIPPCADVTNVMVCVESATYTFTQQLVYNATESYFIIYQRCCRTDEIVNIFDPKNQGATYSVEITPAAFLGNNNSSTFLNFPPTFICNNFDLNFDHSAVDVDGDSLSYSFCTPISGGGRTGGGGGCDSPIPNPPCAPPWDEVTFVAPYSATEQMVGVPAVVIDSVTGLMTGKPFGLGQYVVGVCAKEYRNGVQIGTTIRDFQFNVVNCATVVISKIRESVVIAGQGFVIATCGQTDFTVINDSPPSQFITDILWEFDLGDSIFTTTMKDATFTVPSYGEYTGALFLNRGGECPDSAYIKIIAQPDITANFGFTYDICEDKPVYFQDSTVAEASGGVKVWNWDMGVNASTLENPIIQFPSYGTYPVTLTVIDTNNCKDVITKIIDWQPQLLPEVSNFPTQVVCVPQLVTFDVIDSVAALNARVDWDFGDGTSMGNIVKPTHLYDKVGTYYPRVLLSNDYDCVASDTLTGSVIVNPSPTADFDYLPKKISNIQNEIKFEDQSSDDVLVWEWMFGQSGNSREQNPRYSAIDTGAMKVIFSVMNQYGCIDTTFKILDIVPKVKLYVPNVFSPDKAISDGNDRFGVMGIIPGTTLFDLKIWSRWGELVFQTDNPAEGWDGHRQGNKKLLPSGVYTYTLTLKDTRGEPTIMEGTVTLVK